jgi:hypothetical protein
MIVDFAKSESMCIRILKSDEMMTELSRGGISRSGIVTGHPVTCTAVVVLQWLVGRIEGVCEDLGLRRVD